MDLDTKFVVEATRLLNATLGEKHETIEKAIEVFMLALLKRLEDKQLILPESIATAQIEKHGYSKRAVSGIGTAYIKDIDKPTVDEIQIIDPGKGLVINKYLATLKELYEWILMCEKNTTNPAVYREVIRHLKALMEKYDVHLDDDVIYVQNE